VRKLATSFILIFSFCAFGLGFNTLDAMMWQFYNTSEWRVWYPNQWALTPMIRVDVWFSYMLLGIAPLIIGAFTLGYAVAKSVG